MVKKNRPPRNQWHDFINYPNQGTRKCLRCGILQYNTSVKGVSNTKYNMNGVISTEFVPCKKKEIFE